MRIIIEKVKRISNKPAQNLSSILCLDKTLYKFASKFVFYLREFSHNLHTQIQTFTSQNSTTQLYCNSIGF